MIEIHFDQVEINSIYVKICIRGKGVESKCNYKRLPIYIYIDPRLIIHQL